MADDLMDVHGHSIREHQLGDGFEWQWDWPNVQTVERNLRWTTEAHKWVAGMRVDGGGWNFRELVGHDWWNCRSEDRARVLVRRFVAWDLGLPPPDEDEEESA